jgi:CubicO group peptidase (beta-lactamase class C family)
MSLYIPIPKKKLFKSIVTFIFCLCFILPNVFSQTLSTHINTIKNNHDLMGGVVVVFCKNQILESIPFGTADYSRSISVTDSTAFRIASISKTITAIAVMQLWDDGLLNLDADINTILGYSVRNHYYTSTPITCRMLLSHTSGIIDGNTYSNFLSVTYNNNPIPDISELLSPTGSYYSTSNYNNIQPGTYFNYSNLNFGILGTIVEKVSGLRFDEYCRQNILFPLGIQGSFNVNHISNIDNVAVLYRKVSGNWVAQADNFQGVQPVFGNLTGYVPGTNGLRFAPQGGLRISGDDLAKIFMALLNNGSYNGYQLLSQTSVSAMLNTEWLFNGSNGNNYYGLFRSWGLGMHIITNTLNNDVVLSGSTKMFGHPGEAYGLVSDAYIDTTREVGLIFLTNGCGAGYHIGSGSAFYSVEKHVFDAIEAYGNVNSCLTVDISRHEKNGEMIIFPNPASDFLMLSSDISLKDSPFYIYSSTGQMVLLQNLNDNLLQIDISYLAPGLYFLNIPETGFKARFVKN